MQFPVIKILIILTTLLGGVFYCGWTCSFGFIQDVAAKLGRRLGIKRRQIPQGIHKIAVYMRYILAVITMVITTDFVLSVLQLESRGAFLGLISGRIPSVAALIIIGFFILLSVKYDRVYCKYICPEGARYGVMSLVRPFTLQRNEDVCVNCGKCDQACLMQIQVSNAGKLRSPQCVNCFECMSACPVDGAIKYRFAFSKSQKA